MPFAHASVRTVLAALALLPTLACTSTRLRPISIAPDRPRAVVSQDTWITPSPDDPRGTDSLTALTRTSTALLEDGSIVLLEPDGSPAFATLTREGTLRLQTPHRAPAQQCTVAPAGNAVLRQCTGTREGNVHAWWIDRHQLVALPEPISSQAISDPTGESVAFDGPCDPTEPDDGTTFCWLRRDQPHWREWSAPNRANLLAIRGENALLSEPGELRATLVHFSITTSRRVTIEQTDPTLEIDAATFSPTGDVIVLSHRTKRSGAIESFACVAAVGVPCTARPLHIHAMDIAFADARHGIAVGSHANEVSITHDGGASWRPILPSGHPHPESVALPALRSERSSRRSRIRPASTLVQCNSYLCLSGRLIHRWPED